MRIQIIFQKALGIAILCGFLLGLFLIITASAELYQMTLAQEWSARKGIVTYSRAGVVYSQRRGEIWSPDIRGVFQDNGEKFLISRVRYGDFPFGNRKKLAQQAAGKYPVGSIVNVYYAPDNPRYNILEPFAPRQTMVTVLAIGVGLTSIPLLLYLFRRRLGHVDS